MNSEQLAFVNQQLAGMLKSGIPLEGALRQLCLNMRQGDLRRELEALEADLAKGLPLRQALAARALPEFYVKMLQMGAQTNDLPGVLTLVADYYQRANLVWTRLKGLMTYPAIVLVASLGLATFVAVLCSRLTIEAGEFVDASVWGWRGTSQTPAMLVAVWVPVVGLFIVALAFAALLLIPKVRRSLRWRLPGFRESSLTSFAEAMSLMLHSGSPLDEALALAQSLEAGTPAGVELANWKTRLSQGHTGITEFARPSSVFPPLFLWLVAQGGEDLAKGFKRAAEIYYARAVYRVELLLYAALPVSVLLLGMFIVAEFLPLMQAFASQMNMLGSDGGGGPME